jgi:2-dehydropantoate 2-reductase
LAAHLAASGRRLVVVEPWEEHRAALQKHGLELKGRRTLRTPPLEVVAGIPDLAGYTPDLLILAYKIPEAFQAIPDLAALPGETPILLLQNGLGVEEPFLAAFAGGRIFRMVVNYAGRVEHPGTIQVAFFNHPNYLGHMGAHRAAEGAAGWAELFTRCGLETQAAEDIARRIWQKVILNAMLAPVTAVLGVSMGEALRRDGVTFLVENLLEECLRVAEACGFRFPTEFSEFGKSYVLQGDGHRPSMLLDLDRGRRTEIDHLNGRIVELAHAHGIPVPFNEAIVALVKSREPMDAGPGNCRASVPEDR